MQAPPRNAGLMDGKDGWKERLQAAGVVCMRDCAHWAVVGMKSERWAETCS